MKRKKIKLHYKKERVVFSDVLPYELPITFTNRFFYRFLVKNGVEYTITINKKESNKLKWNSNASVGVRQILAILFNKQIHSGDKELNIRKDYTIPFSYRILHKQGKYRELAIIHPAEQIKMVAFYEKYKSLILYYCQQSRFSLRHPNAVACYFYYRDNLHHTLLGKRSDNVELFFNEYENLKTFFSYKRYTQLYRFYEDYRFQRAEKKFYNLQKFDIQSCFNSIYTHSLAWATNGGKSVYKQFFNGEDGTMGSIWDRLMQRMNYNETNGIVIGPEFSRIFAEIIFQYIDRCVENDLLAKGFRFNIDYECYRYVDDYFFFYNNPDVLNAANESYARHLNEYKLRISKEKTEDFVRPFITPISRAKIAIDRLINETICINIEDEILRHNEDEEEEKDLSLTIKDNEPEVVIDNERLEKALKKRYTLYFRSSYFSSVFQDILKANNVEAKSVLNYTIYRIALKCERMLKKFDKLYKPLCLSEKISNITKDKKAEVDKRKRIMEHDLSLFLFNLLDSAFFIYSFSRQLNSTLKMMNLLNNIIIYLDNEYSEIKKVNKKKEIHSYKRFTAEIRSNVFKKIQDEINDVFQCNHYSEDVQLETLFFLITLRSLNDKYLLPPIIIEKYIGIRTDNNGKKYLPSMNALSITLFLYYFRKKEMYSELRCLIIEKACERMRNTPECIRKKTTEFIILLLDLMACPFLNEKEKGSVAESFGLKAEEKNNLLAYFKNGRYMFTNWDRLNVTKELNAKISQEVYA